MASSMRASLLGCLCALALGACGEMDDVMQDPPQGPCETTTASYETVGEPFMRTWCTPCHHEELEGRYRPAGSEDVDLNSYALVRQHLDRIEARALGESPTMPPAGGPSPGDLDRLRLWIECGAVETTTDP